VNLTTIYHILIVYKAPGGSSVGSAMGIAAGFAPLSIGTDTVGSIVTPSNRAGLYGLRPTLGSVDMGGVFGLSPTFDIAGPMAKSVKDLISLTHILLETPGDFNFREGWSGLSIGSVEPELWRISEDHCKQHEGTFEQMVCFSSDSESRYY
jgi:amidase